MASWSELLAELQAQKNPNWLDEKLKEHIEKDTKLAHLWAPILQNMGPSLVLEADKALSYSKELVVGWLHRRMLKGVSNEEERKTKADTIAAYFNAEETPSHGQVHVHGQRIGAEKLEELGLKLEFLEDDQDLQNDVLTAYHLMTLIFEKSPSLKFIISDKGKMWVKQQQQILIPSPPPVPQQSSPDAFVDRRLRSADVEDRKSAIATSDSQLSGEYHHSTPKGPCVLLLQRTQDGRSVHVVWGLTAGHTSPAVLITAYLPDPEKWKPGFKRRRQ